MTRPGIQTKSVTASHHKRNLFFSVKKIITNFFAPVKKQHHRKSMVSCYILLSKFLLYLKVII